MKTLVTEAGSPVNNRAVKIIAKSLFQELKQYGYQSNQIVTLTTELIGLVTSDIQTQEKIRSN